MYFPDVLAMFWGIRFLDSISIFPAKIMSLYQEQCDRVGVWMDSNANRPSVAYLLRVS
jgi:hypothetical protein